MKNTILIAYDTVYPFHKGGGEYRIYQIAYNLVIKGWKVIWLCSKCWEGNSDEYILNGIYLKAVCSKNSSLKKSNRSRRSLFNTIPFVLGLFKTKIPVNTNVAPTKPRPSAITRTLFFIKYP